MAAIGHGSLEGTHQFFFFLSEIFLLKDMNNKLIFFSRINSSKSFICFLKSGEDIVKAIVVIRPSFRFREGNVPFAFWSVINVEEAYVFGLGEVKEMIGDGPDLQGLRDNQRFLTKHLHVKVDLLLNFYAFIAV